MAKRFRTSASSLEKRNLLRIYRQTFGYSVLAKPNDFYRIFAPSVLRISRRIRAAGKKTSRERRKSVTRSRFKK